MIATIFSLTSGILSCLAFLATLSIVFAVRWYVVAKRKPNEKQIHALRVMLPTNAERPLELHPVDLERLALYVYQRLGYRNVKHTGVHSSTDGGVDVWMLNQKGDVEIVQCKQWRTPVGSSEIIEFAKVMRQQHAEIGHYWSPIGYTKPAKQYASRADNILLLDDYQIRLLLEKAVETDNAIAVQRSTRIPTLKRKVRKRLTAPQNTILFGMALVACAVVYCLIAVLVTGGGN